MVGVRVRPLSASEMIAGADAGLRLEQNYISDAEYDRSWHFDFVWQQDVTNATVYSDVRQPAALVLQWGCFSVHTVCARVPIWLRNTSMRRLLLV